MVSGLFGARTWPGFAAGAIQISRTRNTVCSSMTVPSLRTCSCSLSARYMRSPVTQVATANIPGTQSDCRCCSSPFDQLSVIVIHLAGLYSVLVKTNFLSQAGLCHRNRTMADFSVPSANPNHHHSLQRDQILAFWTT